jgi:hypothetical protein
MIFEKYIFTYILDYLNIKSITNLSITSKNINNLIKEYSTYKINNIISKKYYTPLVLEIIKNNGYYINHITNLNILYKLNNNNYNNIIFLTNLAEQHCIGSCYYLYYNSYLKEYKFKHILSRSKDFFNNFYGVKSLYLGGELILFIGKLIKRYNFLSKTFEVHNFYKLNNISTVNVCIVSNKIYVIESYLEKIFGQYIIINKLYEYNLKNHYLIPENIITLPNGNINNLIEYNKKLLLFTKDHIYIYDPHSFDEKNNVIEKELSFYKINTLINILNIKNKLYAFGIIDNIMYIEIYNNDLWNVLSDYTFTNMEGHGCLNISYMNNCIFFLIKNFYKYIFLVYDILNNKWNIINNIDIPFHEFTNNIISVSKF